MLKKKVIVGFLILGIAIFVSNAFALPPGTPFTFEDIVIPNKANPWTHFLDNTDFSPSLDGTEPFLIIDYANLTLKLNFKPKLLFDSLYGFFALPTLDGYILSNNLISYIANNNNPVNNWLWSTNITNPDALNAIADKQAEIQITTLWGTLKKIKYSSVSGGGSVGPEPVSMLLVGFGLAGLPVAGRLRRFIKGE